MRIAEIRKRVLEDWRGLPEETARPERCVPAADALKKLIQKLGLTERLNEQEIQAAWREIVGDFLAGAFAPGLGARRRSDRPGDPARGALRTRPLLEAKYPAQTPGPVRRKERREVRFRG